jgi:SulP family sulfate permease
LAFLVLGTRFIAQIPMAALAGVTAWVGARLLDWSTWRRLHKMRLVDSLAFASTAFLVLVVNAVAAVALGCAWYLLRHVYLRWRTGAGTRNVQESLSR